MRFVYDASIWEDYRRMGGFFKVRAIYRGSDNSTRAEDYTRDIGTHVPS